MPLSKITGPSAFTCWLLLLAASQPAAGQQLEKPKEIGVLVRVQRKVVEELLDQDVELSVDVNQSVDGIPIWGVVNAVAKPTVVWEKSDSESAFTLLLEGFADAYLTADAGPATAQAASRTSFDIGKRIRFDGRKFLGDQATIATGTSASITAVCPKRRGLVGRLISKVGGRMARQAIPEINAAIDSTAQVMLTEYFDDAATSLLDELNASNAFEQTARYFKPADEVWEFKTVTEEQFLVAGAGPVGAVLPRLPDQAGAPIEVWLRIRPEQDAFLQLVGEWNAAHDAIVAFLNDEETPPSQDGFEDDLEVARVGEWTVLRLALADD